MILTPLLNRATLWIAWMVTMSLGSMFAGEVNATFNSPSDVPVTAADYSAAGNTVNLTLNFHPAPENPLMVVENTGLSFIKGSFTNLAQGQLVNLTHAGITYPYVANYFGGTGNDLVLQWQDIRAYGWGNNASGQIGTGSTGSGYVPMPVSVTGVLAGKTIVQISSGFYFSAAVCSDGTVATWGLNKSGQLGNNSTTDSSSPVNITNSGVLAGKSVVFVSAGYDHCLALCSDGTVAAWGDGGNGQLGNNSTASSNVPVSVNTAGVLAGRKVVAISAGANYSLALCSDGLPVSWGTGGFGNLGDGTIGREAHVPVNVTATGVLSGKKVTAISAGKNHALALCSDNTVVAWGSNNDGQTGGNSGSSPVLINPLGVLAGKTVTSISAGDTHSIALCSDGSVAAWGRGKLGDGTLAVNSTPVAVSTAGILSGKSVIAAVAGYTHSAALCSDGTLAAWGENGSYQLGNQSGSLSDTYPVEVLATPFGERKCVALVSGHSAYHNFVLAAQPSAANDSKLASLVLADGNLERSLAPSNNIYPACVSGATSEVTLVPSASNPAASIKINGMPVATGSASQPIQLISGTNNVSVTVTALDGSSTIYQVSILRPSNLDVHFTSGNVTPVTFDGYEATGLSVNLSLGFIPSTGTDLTIVKNTSGGFIKGTFTNLPHGAAITLDYGGFSFPFVVDYFGGTGNDLVLKWAKRRTYAFGSNAKGQLGDNSLANSNVPKRIQETGILAGKIIKMIAVGDSHTLALCYDGTLAAWGDDSSGQLGDALGIKNSSIPIAVNRTGVLAGKTVVSVTAGHKTSYAVCSDGSVASWGDDNYGQLGTGRIVSGSRQEVPVAVSATGALASRSVVSVSAGNGFCFALCSDGVVASWGLNGNGQLGNRSTSHSGTPVLVDRSGVLAGRIVTSVSAGSGSGMALCSDGTLASWGHNGLGQLGNNSATDRTWPVPVTSTGALAGKVAVGLSAGSGFTYALCSDGSRVAWGSNSSGAFGNGTSDSSSVPVLISPLGALVGRSLLKINAASGYGLGICSDGALVGTGGNLAGQLGTGNNVSSSIPVLSSASLLEPGEKFADVAAGSMASHSVVMSAVPMESAITGLSGLTLSSGSISPQFASNTTSYSASVSNGVTSITVTPTAKNPMISVTVNGATVPSGSSSPAINLVEGPNSINVRAISADGSAVMNYLVTVTRGINLNARFLNANSVPLSTFGFTASGSFVNLSLSFTPIPGTTLTVVKNTAASFIQGEFDNLKQFQTVELTYLNTTYKFVADYYGGSGNDLVLIWLNNRVSTWGSNSRGQLGDNSTVSRKLPVAVAGTGLSGKTVVRTTVGSMHCLALCSDGTLFAWGNNSSGALGIGGTTNSLVPAEVNRTGALAGKVVVSIAAGSETSFALCSDGSLFTWGSNNNGMAGTGDSEYDDYDEPVEVSKDSALAGKTVTAISAGASHCLALCSDGSVVAWGWGHRGQLGNGGTSPSLKATPVTMSGALAGKTVVGVSAGVLHSLALCSDGTLVSWGANDYGQVGNNSTSDVLAPVVINTFGALAGKSLVSFCAGGYHSLVSRSDGTVVSWGRNESGQLGINSTTDSKVPVAVVATGVLSKKVVTALSAASQHSLVMSSDGAMAAWGVNYDGRLGNNSLTNSSVPVSVSTNPLSAGERFMACPSGVASSHSMATVAEPLPTATGLAATFIGGTGAQLNGKINAIGNSVSISFEYGMDANYGSSVAASPGSASGGTDVNVSASISNLLPGTVYHFRVVATCASGVVRSSDMTFTTLSDNAKLGSLALSQGVLLPGFLDTRSIYVSTVANSVGAIRLIPTIAHPGAKARINGVVVPSGSASEPVSLPVGNTTIDLVVTAEDGITNKTYRVTVTRLPSSFVFNTKSDVPVTSNEFSAGGYPVNIELGFAPQPGTVLTMVRNTGLGFISGAFGNLAQGESVTLSFGGTSYDFVANYFGGSGNDLVLQWAETSLFGWGANAYGQLGMAPVAKVLVPSPVDDSGVLSGKTLLTVSSGYLHSLALCSDGTLASWGYNVYGQLGNNGSHNSDVPVSVDRSGALAGKTVVAISSGPFHNLVLCSDGTVAAWGYNNYGQLGTGDKVTSRVPVRVKPVGALLGKSVVAVAAGAYQSFALCSDGTVAAWGYNDEGELGDGGTNTSSVPVSVDASGSLSGKKVAAIAAGQYHSLALCSDGTLHAWGYNKNGQLGNNSTVSSRSPVAIGAFGALAGRSILALSAGSSHSLALCSDASLIGWGSNSKGQLGSLALAQSVVPVLVDLAGVSGIDSSARIATGSNHCLLSGSDAGLHGWGENSSGQLGNNSSVSSSSPVLWDAGEFEPGMRLMSAASGISSQHSLAIMARAISVSTSAGVSEPSSPSVGTGTQDSDLDGIPDLVEYAFGLDPHQTGVGNLPQASWTDGSMEIRFVQPQGVTGVVYSAEWTASLKDGEWMEIPDSGIGNEHVFRLPADGRDRCFVRLKVTKH
jgi:alpha-tubulin suppressor-like RCC1 family protein